MTRMNLDPTKVAAPETTRYRFLFSLYCAFGFSLSCWVYTYVGTIVYGTAPECWAELLGTIPPHFPLGHSVLLGGVPLFPLLYWRVAILRRLRIRNHCGSRAAIVLLLYMAFVGASQVQFGGNIYIVGFGLMYGVVFALTDAIRAYREDFSFLGVADICQSAKLAKLQMMHERWFRYLMALLTVACGILIGSAIGCIIAEDKDVQALNALMALIVIGYLFLGIVWGGALEMLRKMREIENRILEV